MTVRAATRHADEAPAKPARRHDVSTSKVDAVGLLEQGAYVDAGTGFLHTRVRATRTGVFEYKLADGSVLRELRHPDDVLERESLASLMRVIATKGHPRNPDGTPRSITTANARELTVGHAGDAIEVETVGEFQHPVVGLTVTDKTVIDDMVHVGTDGKLVPRNTQVSMQYTVQLDDEQGVYLGQAYDVRQRKIRYEAIGVDLPGWQGRGGPSVSIMLDEGDAQLVGPAKPTPAKRTDDMEEVEIRLDDGTVIKVKAHLAPIILASQDKLKAKLDAAIAKADAAEAKTKEVEKARDTAQAKADEATKALDAAKAKVDAADQVGAHTTELLEVLTVADSLVDVTPERRAELLALPAAKADDKTPDPSTLADRIRKAVVVQVLGDEAVKALETTGPKSIAYWNARFDAMAEDAAKGKVPDRTGAAAKKLGGAGKTGRDANKKTDEALAASLKAGSQDPLAGATFIHHGPGVRAPAAAS